MKRSQRKRHDDDEQKIYENVAQQNKVTEEHSQQQAEEHSQQQARRAQPTAGEKSIPNSRREEHTQQQERIKRTERAVPTAGQDVRREQCLKERSWTGDDYVEAHHEGAQDSELRGHGNFEWNTDLTEKKLEYCTCQVAQGLYS